jgi:hypothetical protein
MYVADAVATDAVPQFREKQNITKVVGIKKQYP